MTLLRKFIERKDAATAVEFALTAPLFMGLIFGIVTAGLALWTQFGLENGAEAAARCASVYFSSTCNSASAITNYAHDNTLGVSIPASAFTYTKIACGNQVTGSYNYSYLTNYFHATQVTLTAQSCFPDINAGG